MNEIRAVKTWADVLGAFAAFSETPRVVSRIVAERNGTRLITGWDNACGIVLQRKTEERIEEDDVLFLTLDHAEAVMGGFISGTEGWDATLSWYPLHSWRNRKHLLRVAAGGWWAFVLVALALCAWAANSPPNTDVVAALIGTVAFSGMALGTLVDYVYKELYPPHYTATLLPMHIIGAIGFLIWLAVSLAGHLR